MEATSREHRDIWRIFSLVMCLFIIYVSFLFGPLNTIMVHLGYNEGKHHNYEYLKKPAHINLLTVMSGLMCLLFCTSFTLLVCILTKRFVGIDCCIIMFTVNMILAATTAIYFLVYCTTHDIHCLGHSKISDVPEAMLLNGFCVVYLFFLGSFSFVLFKYRQQEDKVTMCKLLPSFHGIWRTYNFILAVCCMTVSGILGPVVNLAYYAAGPDGDLATLCRNEPDYCTLLTYIHYVMWIFFFASVLLFFACWYNSICLIHCSMGLVVLDSVLSVILFTKYLIYCAVFDNQCLSHKHNDVYVVANLFLMNFLYVLLLGTALFFMNEFKTSLLHAYIGFVLF